ncbi:hypothetical protein APE_2311a [Aeropyrum pernix K1]|uniref:Uncharacterized protein n=1 Tax=Aeropyrum pernix (strain ATCC 700893 / DSM 11879 / JCM 9820 / NBRC 100138 / K1) TaxID=272557 RepID=Q05DX4_AERPE|nr:hypothetical protein [Aeropyrum pernix]BAF34827.1 hypothetical protein APE_2311a [Aeropyrum pernix K1]
MSRRLEGRLPEIVAIGLAMLFAALSLYFFGNALSLITLEEPRVAASLLAALIGLALLSASVSLARSLVLSRALEREEKPS